ncbi:hypothetical protein [Paraburkholderia sp. J67]|uniref:hypothetical protein n=1 Tax=Paraburkholderia sp. J67 TaxID=2805435 RepID=UPI002ABD15D9|nr:hypothetical protein [Paraburkholderia sp. J67]
MRNFDASCDQVHALCNSKEIAQALELTRQLASQPSTVSDFVKLGYCQSRLGLFNEAESSLNIALRHLPGTHHSAFVVGNELVAVKYSLGKVEEGVALEKQLYGRQHFRLPAPDPANVPEEINLRIREKLLEDGQSVAGKSVFVMPIGGIGDTLQQYRHIEHLIAEGASAVFINPREATRELILNSRLPVNVAHATIGDLARHDFVALGNILALRYRNTPSQGGYLKPIKPHSGATQLPAVSGKRKIGLVWRSTNATWPNCRLEPFRSTELGTLKPLLVNDDVQFYSLQFGGYTPAEQAILSRHRILDLSPVIHSCADLAAIMVQLDKVISICSAPAHLAGALDVPVWTMLSRIADWRWGTTGQTATSLYPSMRLIRQTELDNWEPVIAEMASRLERGEH